MQADDADFGGGNQIEHAVEHAQPRAQDGHDGNRFALDALAFDFAAPALQGVGFETIAAGDSYNDLGMIRASKGGFLFKSPEKIKNENQDVKTVESYEELLSEIKKVINEAK